VHYLSRLAIVKLGGSVITYKSESPARINIEAVTRISQELSTYSDRLVVVLGGGAHGHQAASQYGYGNASTPPTMLLAGIPLIRHNMTLLALQAEQALSENGRPAVVIPPFCIARMQNGRILSFDSTILTDILKTGSTIVTHGDVCIDTIRGASILSGDSIVTYLTQQLHPDDVLIGTDVDGVFDSNPHTNPSARLIPVIDSSNRNQTLAATGPSKNTDVTGGMEKKVLELLELHNVPSRIIIFNLSVPDRLRILLAGNSVPSTRVIPD
jgi:isopentenyl phosphate kinase